MDDLKTHMLLYYDICMVMNMLQDKLRIPVRWHKVDSYIKIRVYNEGTKPEGDEFTIRLYTVVDNWAGAAQEEVEGASKEIRAPQIWCAVYQVMAQLKDSWLVYGDIEHHVICDIT